MAEAFAPANPVEVMMVEAQAGRMPMGALMTALLTSPVYLAPSQGSGGGELSLAAREGPDGALYIPAFTDPGRLRRFSGSARSEEPGGEQTVPAGTSVMIGDPAAEPEAVLSAVALTCSKRPEVVAAYRAQLHVDRPGERPHLAIEVMADPVPEDPDELRRAVAESATGAGADQVSVVFIDPGAEGDAIAAYMLEQTRPFFTRDA